MQHVQQIGYKTVQESSRHEHTHVRRTRPCVTINAWQVWMPGAGTGMPAGKSACACLH